MKIGAYAIERDYSHYVAYAAKTIFAVVGTATKGPVGKAIYDSDSQFTGYEGVATVCTSSQDLVNKFGPLHDECYGLYAGQYFLSQSSKLYFVRAASKSLAGSSVVIPGKGTGNADVEDALTIEFLDKGTYYDGYKVSVSAGTSKVAGSETIETYTLAIKNRLGTTIESIKDITLDDLNEDYTSKYIQVIDKDTAAISLVAGEYTFSGGNDGIEDIDDGDYINAAKALIPETVDMNLFAVPGQSSGAVITAMLSIAESRGDCLYLVDPPKGLSRDAVVAWHNGGGDYTHAAFNSSYGALYYDWLNIYDSINKVYVEVPPSVVVAATIAYSDRTTELWYAPAGLNRGIVRGALNSVTSLSKSDAEYLYDNGNSINAIIENPQVGLVVWGQKTLLKADTALNRVNVRRLMNYLKRIIVAACDYLTFEPNDRSTWNSFEMKVRPVLDNIKNGRGIYNYRIIKGETIVTNEDIDNHRMPCMVMIRPTKAAEEIPIYFTITSTGADFNDVLEANGIITNE